MSEPEFDLYLSLMSKFLRLNAAQKDDIAEELRVHLEDRLAELQAQGKSRDEAIRLALDEFGDAGALAWQFTLPHSLRRRRQIMRYSIGSFVALAGIFTLVSLTWPSRPDTPPALSTVVAQVEAQPEATSPVAAAKGERPDEIRRELEAKLNEYIVTGLDFDQLKFGDALEFLGELMAVNIVLDASSDGDYAGATINLKVRENTPIRGKTVLELILRQLGDANLEYVFKDGLILITNSTDDYEVQVYDCRDLLAGVQMQGMLQAGGFGGGFPGMAGNPAAMGAGPAAGGLIGPGMRKGGRGFPTGDDALAGQAKASRTHQAAAATSVAGTALMGVIQSATQPAHWINTDGEGGSMSEFDGVIVVRHHQAVHRKIEDVLAKLRKVKHVQQAAMAPTPEDVESLDIPPGKRLVTLHANQWRLPVEAKIRPGSRLDLVVLKPDGRQDGVLENLQIAWLDAQQAAIGDGTKHVMIVQQLGFIVTPEEADELMFAQHTKSGHWYFRLRGEQEDDEDAVERDAEMEDRGDEEDNDVSETDLGRPQG